MSTSAQHGYLVIADISDYTSFVAKTELEHSHEILTELLELLVNKFQPLMTISKLEGDAVFAFANDGVFARGETLIDFIESMYVAFRDKQLSMKRATTCTCNACRNIPSLDLKFFVHCGDFIQQKIASIRELVVDESDLSAERVAEKVNLPSEQVFRRWWFTVTRQESFLPVFPEELSWI